MEKKSIRDRILSADTPTGAESLYEESLTLGASPKTKRKWKKALLKRVSK